MMLVLVLALGNPILCDDGVAFHVVERLRSINLVGSSVVLDEASAGGIDLLSCIEGFDRVLIIDSIKTPGGEPGQVHHLTEEDLKETLNLDSPHSTSFATALEMGRRLHPEGMPEEIAILAIEVDVIDRFGEELTPNVGKAVPEATESALGILRMWGVEVGQ
jgi:hydrogenase maturation protease